MAGPAVCKGFLASRTQEPTHAEASGASEGPPRWHLLVSPASRVLAVAGPGLARRSCRTLARTTGLVSHQHRPCTLATQFFAAKVGSCPEFVKRGGLEVLQYFPAHGWGGEAAPFLRRNLLILLAQVAILMASRTLAKNPRLAVIVSKIGHKDQHLGPWWPQNVWGASALSRPGAVAGLHLTAKLSGNRGTLFGKGQFSSLRGSV
jgi:hypothetical protein